MITPPPISKVDNDKAVNQEWRNFFSAIYNICHASASSGTTANRPTSLLWTGRVYFDTDLGYPIWYKTSSWVKSDGTAA